MANQSTSRNGIVITHLNIRQSISFLLLRLVAIDIIAAILVIAFYMTLLTFNVSEVNDNSLIFNIPVYLFFVFLKMFFVVYVVLQWLNEYYELSPKEIYHRSGVLFKKEEKFPISNLGRADLSQNFMGKILNYGSIKIFDHINKLHMTLYLIHNPLRYFRVLEELVPEVEEKRETIRGRVYENNEENTSHLIFKR